MPVRPLPPPARRGVVVAGSRFQAAPPSGDAQEQTFASAAPARLDDLGVRKGPGYSLDALGTRELKFELGIDAQRRESPVLGRTSNSVLGRETVDGSGDRACGQWLHHAFRRRSIITTIARATSPAGRGQPGEPRRAGRSR